MNEETAVLIHEDLILFRYQEAGEVLWGFRVFTGPSRFELYREEKGIKTQLSALTRMLEVQRNCKVAQLQT